MVSCPECGTATSGGRFCIQCGTRLPVSDQVVPPPPVSGARYPLFADEVEPGAPVARQVEERVEDPHDPEPTVVAPQVAAPPQWEPLPDTPAPRLWPLWLGGLVTFVLVLVLGMWLLFRGPDDEREPVVSDESASATAGSGTSAEPAPGPTSAGGVPTPLGGAAHDLTADAEADAPATASPATDVSGQTVTFEAANMLDGDPATAWRMPGDGTGVTLRFELGEPATLTEVGLVNGYAKTGRSGDRTFDWYAGNRRILEVEWSFGDGTTVRQSLRQTRELQTVEVPDVTTSTVELRLLRVSAPGSGPAGRDNTPVSEVSLVGRTG